MKKVKEPDYDEFNDEVFEKDDLTDSDLDYDDDDVDDSMLSGIERPKRTWRDTEKYLEMRELYKIINDELYTGLYSDDIFDNQDYDY